MFDDCLMLVSCLSLLIWLYLAFARGRFWQTLHFDDSSVPLPEHWPDVCAVIPARNEAHILPTTLPTLIQAGYAGGFKIILVDDRSEDGTAARAQEIAALHHASDRVTVITAASRPAGWKGKVWAMHCGVEHVRASAHAPRYILLTDADIAYDAGAVSQLVAQAEAEQLVLVTRMVKLHCVSVAERWLIPAFVYFFQMLYPFSWVNQRHHAMAGAAGGVMLTRLEALDKVGGLSAIRDALIDDCALGRLLKTCGGVQLALTRRIHSMRPYPAFHDIREMVVRTAYDQLRYSPWYLLASMAGMVLTYLVPLWFAVMGEGLTAIAGTLSYVIMCATFYPMIRYYERSALYCLLLPLIALCYMVFTMDSAYQFYRGRGGMWKGRIQATDAQTG
ncbi:MAG: glycosyltransferase [Rickettsiales bacterium]|nr:glycosyltransferase [Rickettsiales bacterium]